MTRHVAVSHYPEGAGHATRMMAVARGLERRGVEVSLAGGGPGRRLYGPNGYTAHEPPQVDYIGDYQGAGDPVRGLARVLTGSLPDSLDRVRAIRSWLRREAPDAVVTDDMFTVAAAATTAVPLYVLSHNAAALYRDPLISASTVAINRCQRLAADRFFYPTVWHPTVATLRGSPACRRSRSPRRPTRRTPRPPTRASSSSRRPTRRHSGRSPTDSGRPATMSR